MAEKVDQDVREAAALIMRHLYAEEDGSGAPILFERDVKSGKYDDHYITQALARMKAAGREQGLREAAEVAQQYAVNADWSFNPRAAPGAIATAITALLSEKPA